MTFFVLFSSNCPKKKKKTNKQTVATPLGFDHGVATALKFYYYIILYYLFFIIF
jgi:hypothetical protein